MKFDGSVLVAVAATRLEVPVVLTPVPTAVGPALDVALFDLYVEVTDATTSETVMVLVMVAVDVRVRVEDELSATASRGSKSPSAKVENCIANIRYRCVYPDWRCEKDLRVCDDAITANGEYRQLQVIAIEKISETGEYICSGRRTGYDLVVVRRVRDSCAWACGCMCVLSCVGELALIECLSVMSEVNTRACVYSIVCVYMCSDEGSWMRGSIFQRSIDSANEVCGWVVMMKKRGASQQVGSGSLMRDDGVLGMSRGVVDVDAGANYIWWSRRSGWSLTCGSRDDNQRII
ncbi:hypothetical protein BGZ60DRAFT_151632 [Tricladium varicosporioides]|nr:hypothetical protein BGZ60DRAFT_151632 [Hymenoscyphus varicosporioides]